MKEVVKVVKAYEEAINQNRIIGSICNSCNELAVPPRPICKKCGSDDIDFTTVNGKGKLITWTTIHIAPPSYVDKVPYILGIVELEENNQRLTGMVVLPDGMEAVYKMELVAGFEEAEEGARRLRWVPA